VEICIPGADLPDSVLTHQDGSVSVVQEIAGQVRSFTDDLPGDLGVSWRRHKDIETRRGEERCDELPCLRCVPRLLHHPGMSRDTQKLVKDRPGGIPGVRASPLRFKPASAGGMKRRVLVRRVNQYVCVDDEH